jgi:hypothetical protein
MAMAAHPALTGPRTTPELGLGGDIKLCEKPVTTVFDVEYTSSGTARNTPRSRVRQKPKSASV